MKRCSKCGGTIRDEAVGCTSCEPRARSRSKSGLEQLGKSERPSGGFLGRWARPATLIAIPFAAVAVWVLEARVGWLFAAFLVIAVISQVIRRRPALDLPRGVTAVLAAMVVAGFGVRLLTPAETPIQMRVVAEVEFNRLLGRGEKLLSEGRHEKAAQVLESARSVKNAPNYGRSAKPLLVKAAVLSGDEDSLLQVARQVLSRETDEQLADLYGFRPHYWLTGDPGIDARLYDAMKVAARKLLSERMEQELAEKIRDARAALDGGSLAAREEARREMREMIRACTACAGIEEGSLVLHKLTSSIRKDRNEKLEHAIEEASSLSEKKSLEEHQQALRRLAPALANCRGCPAGREGKALLEELSGIIEAWPLEMEGVEDLRARFEEAREHEARAIGVLTRSEHYDCKYDRAEKWRSFRLEGRSEEVVNLYCPRGEEHCEKIARSLREGSQSTGAATVMYPRSNPGCERDQARLLGWEPH